MQFLILIKARPESFNRNQFSGMLYSMSAVASKAAFDVTYRNTVPIPFE